MYRSSETVSEFIDRVTASLDLAAACDRSFLLRELTTLEQMLYSGYIFDQRMVYPAIEDGSIDLNDIIVPAGERTPTADDVFAVFCGGTQLTRSTLFAAETAGNTSRGCYYRSDEETVEISLPEGGLYDDVVIFYYARPAARTSDSEETDHVALPDEFLSLAVSKLLGEAYLAADDDTLAAKWLSDFNSRLSAFSDYIAEARRGLGRIER